ncbi:MAG: hypothetical protein HYZ81_22185, partial [Nitrospinae bacterium]|nr:hypothetical protein [Nitrospinota bacterium]
GQAQGTDFFAIHPDGTGVSRLLEGAPPSAFHYQPRVSPNGGQILWTSTWDPVSNRPSSHTLLLADLVADSNGFHLENTHSIVPIRDHGFYESGDFALDYPNDPRFYFTSSSQSMQSGRSYVATLTPGGVFDQVFKLTFPQEAPAQPFTVDFHPGWYEFASPVDGGQQFTFISSVSKALAADRFDWFLTFPPYLEGSFIGLTLFDIKFAGAGDIGYDGNVPRMVANIDGTNLQLVFGNATQAGWKVITDQEQVVDGQIFFNQDNSSLGASRNGVIKFGE